ncbi:DUF6615 family protein [Streptomyces sp. NBC_00847]|uniref:DUF6615 family protein n=1 Tax=Streptomyces sp. NBC_00847 TaxID=2975850 RepID=UPI002253B88E|nr:DUF6615 family protein [Streptomyces sp. NBC_00847]MCX4884673.1 hypothetical protein [Streptomyces sp. NBC_00847]
MTTGGREEVQERDDFIVSLNIDRTPDDICSAGQRRLVRELLAELRRVAEDPRYAGIVREVIDPVTGSARRRAPRTALLQARLAVEDYQLRRRREGRPLLMEETATQILLASASPEIEYYEFTKTEESRYGADWLWVWLDRSGVCFMMLVQAKTLKVNNGRWSLDLGYRSGKGKRRQMDLLLESAEVFGVPFSYVIYAGDRQYRATLECSSPHNDGHCRDRDRAGVSWLAGLSAHNVMTMLRPSEYAADALHRSMPLEDMLGTDKPLPPIIDLNRKVLPHEVRDLLSNPEGQAQTIARMVFGQVSTIRMGQFSAADTALMPLPEGSIVPELPRDRGHLPLPYLPHVFGGLRSSAPTFVQDVMAGRTPPSWVTERLAGIVIVPDSEPEVRHHPPQLPAPSLQLPPSTSANAAEEPRRVA